MFTIKEIIVMIIIWTVFISTVQYIASDMIADAYISALYGGKS